MNRAQAAVVQQFCESLFHHFHHYRRIPHIRFGDQEVKVAGHDDVADHDESIFLPCTLQNPQEEIAALAASKLGAAPITTAGYEV
jgi:hypothetical protein